MGKDDITTNTWIPGRGFKYQVFWPYEEPINQERDDVTVEVQPDNDPNKYGLILTTPQCLQHELECDEEDEAYSLPPKGQVFVRSITNNNIEKLVSDLITRQKLTKKAYVIEDKF
ncbi:MAG: hypothetical protein ABH840_02560 [Nanoarchaeota archaeon]